MRTLRTIVALATAAAAMAAFGPASASAAFGIAAFDAQVLDRGGFAATQAGSHPYSASTSIMFNTHLNEVVGEPVPDADVKTVEVRLPPGFVGAPAVLEQCRIADVRDSSCPQGSQVGIAEIHLAAAFVPAFAPVFNVVPPAGVPARFAFDASHAGLVVFDGRLRSDGDYGLDVIARNVSQADGLLGSTVTLWGTPADPSHDIQRCGIPDEYAEGTCSGTDDLHRPHAAGVPVRAFLTNPTACTPPGVGLETTVSVESWQEQGKFQEQSIFSHLAPGFPLPPEEWGAPQGPTGCDQVPFGPLVKLELSSTQAESPTGMSVDITVPSSGVTNPTSTAQSTLKRAVVTLPEGMTVNPSSAAGLGSCSPDQLAAERADSAPGEGCPLDSKIGTVELETPLLEGTFGGSVFLAKQGDNPFGSLLALYIVVKSPERGVAVKLAGKVDADPETGRLVASFDDNPQLPFSRLHVEFKDGPRAALITPHACGSYVADFSLSPWARPTAPVNLGDSFTITQGPNGTPCPSPDQFAPSFEAGTLTPIAGTYSPLIVNASRPDGSAPLTGLELDLPEGLIGKLRGIPYCPEAALAAASGKDGRAEQASPSCPQASRVGTVTVGAGAGSTPFHVQGTAYLAGPYKGAPLSIAVITPAVAGPFDLGTVVVRARADVHPVTTKIHVTSDPIPQILQGIPLKVRSVSVNTDRPGFTLNPTDCDPTSLGGTLFGVSVLKAVSSRFQVGACKALDFKPKLALQLKGGTKRSQNPALRATLTMPKANQANIERVSVALPHSAFLDQTHIRTICTRVQFAADACPKGSIYGKARAFTPLLDQPLEGPVYLRSSNNPLPDLVVALKGQIEVELAGRIDSVNGGIRNTFSLVPDAPVSKFVLTMQGGRKGLLENSQNLCAGTNRATVKMDAQSGKVHDFRPVVRPKGCRGR